MWQRQSDRENDIWDEETFIAKVEADLPGRSAADIIKHIKFYRMLMKLKSDQKRFTHLMSLRVLF